jgi:hypothetical protein
VARLAVNLTSALLRNVSWKSESFVALVAVEALVVIPSTSNVLPFRIVATFLAARANTRHLK